MKLEQLRNALDAYKPDDVVHASHQTLAALLKVAEAAQKVRAEWTSRHVVNTSLDRCVVDLILAVKELEAQ